MSMKIDTNCYTHFSGPSSRYYDAMNRFNSILKYKLNVVEMEKTPDYNNENLIFDYKNGDIKDASSPIFDGSGSALSLSDAGSGMTLAKAGMFGNNSAGAYQKAADSILRASSGNNSSRASAYFDSNDIRKPSGVTASFIDDKLRGTALYGLGEHFKRAEDLYGVNAVILASIARLESGNGMSKIATDKNNLFGMGAYDNSAYESAKRYAARQDSIYDVAKHLSQNYLRSGAVYFNGYSLDGVNTRYCTNKNWAGSVKRIASEFVK